MNERDALAAVQLGADYVGFNFYESSPRYIEGGRAKKIIGKLPKTIKKVGIFVNERLDNVIRIAKNLNLDLIQLHGDETPAYCRQLKKEMNKKIIKSFRVKNKSDLDKIKEYNVDYYMFDSHMEGLFGGTGRTFNHSLLKNIGKKFFLSGGLNAKNIKKAIKTAKPFAVDTASGVEEKTGKKDIKKIKKFIEAAK